MPKLLYGAAVQGIQEYILRTNKLREIVEASQVVADICTGLFLEVLKGEYLPGSEQECQMREDPNFILHAAGNIKYIFDSLEECARVVSVFPKTVMLAAPGITVSQAVVQYKDDFASAVNELEFKLRVQRNKASRSQTLGLLGIARSRQTGLPIQVKSSPRYVDDNLLVRAFGEENRTRVQKRLDKIVTEDNNWIAVIHADGNGLGSIVQKVGGNATQFKVFSEKLDRATVMSAREAFNSVKGLFEGDDIPIRPVVLSGDDLTIVCRADIALAYVETFISRFEENTAGLFDGIEVFTEGSIRDRMTACAGIAYVKSSYPYYYAYDLAESLCTAAKKDAKDKETIREGKELPQSCIMFHKVQDSFNEDYEKIIKRELSPCENISLKGGPYYLQEKPGRRTVKQVSKMLAELGKEENEPIKSTIRRWLSALFRNEEFATQLLERAKSNSSNKACELLKEATECKNGSTMAYDLLALHTVKTKANEYHSL